MSEDSGMHRSVHNSLSREVAVLAGGCFSGMQDLIRKLPGVLETRVGYTDLPLPATWLETAQTHAGCDYISPHRVTL